MKNVSKGTAHDLALHDYVNRLKDKSKSRIKAVPEKNHDQIKKLMRSKGMILRSRTKNWFWMYKSTIDNYGKKVGAIGIAIYCVLSRFCDQTTTIISYNTIASLLSISKPTVISYILLLEAHGLLLKDKRKYRNGRCGSNVYYLAGGKTKDSGNGKGR